MAMQFLASKLPGVFEIRIEPHCDERGFFARSWCEQEFVAQGLNPRLVQCNISFNKRKGTLRGMHFQTAPHAEAKLVRCTRGSIFDVVLDLRTESRTYKQWVGLTLTAEYRNMAYVPEGCAHGFITLEDNTEVFYQMSEFYDSGSAQGVRWNDPAFGIVWPAEVEVISERDASYLTFK
jgi:dTDP-4-dehydrorhamnose 3,5-epimerase